MIHRHVTCIQAWHQNKINLSSKSELEHHLMEQCMGHRWAPTAPEWMEGGRDLLKKLVKSYPGEKIQSAGRMTITTCCLLCNVAPFLLVIQCYMGREHLWLPVMGCLQFNLACRQGSCITDRWNVAKSRIVLGWLVCHIVKETMNLRAKG